MRSIFAIVQSFLTLIDNLFIIKLFISETVIHIWTRLMVQSVGLTNDRQMTIGHRMGYSSTLAIATN